MVKGRVVLIILILFSVSVSAQQSHPANQVDPGLFKQGGYEFYNNVSLFASGDYAIKANITGATSQPIYGVYGIVNTSSGRGIYGLATHPTQVNYGIFGESLSASGRGVYGYSPNYGVEGQSSGSVGIGVRGWANSFTGNNYGVYGRTDSDTGSGVYGYALNDTGVNYGVYGKTASSSGTGVYGESSSATGGTGVYGFSRSYGVYGSTVASGSGYAGYFTGGQGIYVEKNITTSSNGAFLIEVEAVAGNHCNDNCWSNATCSTGKRIVFGMKGGRDCELRASDCDDGWCTPGATSCNRQGAAEGSGVYIICAKT